MLSSNFEKYHLATYARKNYLENYFHYYFQENKKTNQINKYSVYLISL